jgi:MarR family transcriptional regulator, 2-MHQ and catechol-resistance regulon repressor
MEQEATSPLLFFALCIASDSIGANVSIVTYTGGWIQFFLMKRTSSDAIHVWLVLNKAFQAITRHAAGGIQHAGLGDSDFRVLEVLLHKGPLPVNTIGPKVNLTPGSISVAVDRLYGKGLVSRVESAEDRRIRIVALTPGGKKLIVPVFRKHAADIGKVFSELSSGELQQLESILKKVGKRAEALGVCEEQGSE